MGKSKLENIFLIITSNMKSIILILIGGISVGLFSGHYFLYSLDLEKQIASRDSLINTIQKARIEKEPSDSISSGVIRNDVSTDDLIRYTNKLIAEMNHLNDSLSYYRAYYNLSRKTSKPDFTVEKVGNVRKYTYQPKSVDIDSLKGIIRSGVEESSKELITKLNESYKVNADLHTQLNMYKRAIDKYGIIFSNVKSEGNTISYIIEAPQVDSALMLFPHYRKELKYDSKKKQWTIGIKRFF